MDHLWRALDLRAHFDSHHHSAGLGHAKPDPAFYRLTAARIGLPADALLLVDDARENVARAIQAGWQALLWTGHQPLHALLAGLDLPGIKPG